MRTIRRELEPPLRNAARGYPAVTGPRRAGKTWLLTHCLPRATYHLFEDPDVVARFRHDPQGFLDGGKLPAILDGMFDRCDQARHQPFCHAIQLITHDCDYRAARLVKCKVELRG